MIWNKLTNKEKKLVNDVLRESGYKYDGKLGMPVPLAMFGTREFGDGYQVYSKPGRKLNYQEDYRPRYTPEGKHFANARKKHFA